MDADDHVIEYLAEGDDVMKPLTTDKQKRMFKHLNKRFKRMRSVNERLRAIEKQQALLKEAFINSESVKLYADAVAVQHALTSIGCLDIQMEELQERMRKLQTRMDALEKRVKE